jgi:hypothetical protein
MLEGLERGISKGTNKTSRPRTLHTPMLYRNATWRRDTGAHQEMRYSLYQGLAGLLAHLLNLLATPPRAHGARVVVVVLLLLELDVGAVARYYDGAARLSAAEARALQLGRVLVADRGARRGGAHVVRIRGAAVDVVNRRGKGLGGRHGHGRVCSSAALRV